MKLLFPLVTRTFTILPFLDEVSRTTSDNLPLITRPFLVSEGLEDSSAEKKPLFHSKLWSALGGSSTPPIPHHSDDHSASVS